jgi:hypothetical protein
MGFIAYLKKSCALLTRNTPSSYKLGVGSYNLLKNLDVAQLDSCMIDSMFFLT